MHSISRAFIALSMPLAASAAMAQQHTHHAPPTPLAAPVSPAQTADTGLYRSVFKDYRRFDAALELRDWREVNRTVHERGGWRAYAKEAAASSEPPKEKRP
jgi:hypothetical protein